MTPQDATLLLLWLNPLTPLRNYTALLAALTQCAEHACLADWRLARLISTTLASFAQAERPAGYLFSIGGDERARPCTPTSERGITGCGARLQLPTPERAVA